MEALYWTWLAGFVIYLTATGLGAALAFDTEMRPPWKKLFQAVFWPLGLLWLIWAVIMGRMGK